MRNLLVVNAFSPNMVRPGIGSYSVEFKPVDMEGIADPLPEGFEYPPDEVCFNLVSAIGHADTARLFSQILGADLPVNRITVTLDRGDMVLLGQHRGTRLPEGATELPEGASIEWFEVTIR